jgi:predicted ATPase
MDNYEKAFYDQYGDDNRSAIRSALEFILWVEHVDPTQDEMSAVFQSLPDTERQRMKNAVKHVKSLTQGSQKND